jgi:hypothetical protein
MSLKSMKMVKYATPYLKVKLSLCLTKHRAMKTYWGCGGEFCARWRWVVGFTPRPLHQQGKSPWYPLDRRFGGTQSRSGHAGEENNSQPPPEIEPRSSDRPARNQSLYRLSYHYAIIQKFWCFCHENRLKFTRVRNWSTDKQSRK